MTEARLDAGGMRSISALVQSKLDSGSSLRDLDRLSGGVVSHQQFEKIGKGKVAGFPKVETIRALSKALGVDERAVVLGYAAELGLRVEDDRASLLTRLPADVGELPNEVVDAFSDLIRAVTRMTEDERRRRERERENDWIRKIREEGEQLQREQERLIAKLRKDAAMKADADVVIAEAALEEPRQKKGTIVPDSS